jgi:hypothetical protein
MIATHIIQSIPKNLRPSGLGARATGTDGLGVAGCGVVGISTARPVGRPNEFRTCGRGGATIGAVVIPDGEDE